MLNKEQLSILNDIFHSAIKPAFEENKEALEVFMKKVEEHENWTRIQSVEARLLKSIADQMVNPSVLKNPILKFEEITMAKIKHQIIDLNIENHNIISPTIRDIVTTKITTRKLNGNVSAGKFPKGNSFAS